MGLSAYQRAVLQAGPVGYWPLQEQGFARQVMAETPDLYWVMNEASGNLADSSGNSHGGTATGSPVYGAAGPVANGLTAITFNGSNACFNGGDIATLRYVGVSFSFGVWFKTSGTPAGLMGLLTKSNRNTEAGWALFMDTSGKLNVQIFKADGVTVVSNQTGSHTFNDGNWHLAVVQVTVTGGPSTTTTVYVDGVQETTDTHAAALDSTTFQVGVGARDGTSGVLGQFFQGQLANAFTVSRAISLAEITALYAARTQTDATVSAAATDLSTGAHNGTYTNGPVLGQPAGHLAALAATLNGSTACVSIPSAVSVTDSFTLAAWVNPVSISPADIETILSLDHGSTQLALLTTGKVRFSANLTGSGQQNMNGTASLVASAWQQVTAVWNTVAGTMTIYINGAQDSQTTGLTGPLSLPSTSRFIGQDNNSIATRFWNGSISDGVVYNKALTAAQVAALFLAGKQGYTGSRYRLGSRANWCY